MSLNITKNIGESSVLTLEGRLDTTTAPELDRAVDEVCEGSDKLTLDVEKLEYVSSAGLRVFLKAQKAMSRKGGFKLIHVSPAVKEVLDITGFSDFIAIE